MAQDFDIERRIAAIGQRPPHRIQIFRIDVFIQRDDIFADGAMRF